MEKSDNFSSRLNEALRIRDMKPVELSRRTGISEATISQYRSGYAEPKRDKARLIARTLRVSVAWLMGVSDNMEPSVVIPVNNDLYFDHSEKKPLYVAEQSEPYTVDYVDSYVKEIKESQKFLIDFQKLSKEHQESIKELVRLYLQAEGKDKD